MQTRYIATAISAGDGRSDHARTEDGMIDVALAAPVELGGPGGAAGQAACLHSTLRPAAGKAHVKPSG